MNTPHCHLQPGYYRLPPGVRIVSQDESAVAVCDYPLRLVRLSPAVARLLSLCSEERTCEQLAQATDMSIKRVEALCDQLRWKGLLEAGPALPPPVWPYVSIVIPTYNRAKELERCLRSLFSLDYPCLEIIVVDDASTDETSRTLQRMAQEAAAHGLEMRVVCHEKQQGVGISRNTGTEATQHDLIAYIDSDCVASPDWLKELVPAFQDMRIAAVGGMIRAYERKTLLGRYEDVRSSLFMGMQPQQVRLQGPITYLPTANMVMRRTVWQQLAGFAPLTQGEDVDFCRRLLMSGASMHYLPQGVVYHDYRTTLGAFLRIRAAYASAEAPLLQRHPTERRILLLPPEQATFTGVVVGGGWSILWGFIRAGMKGSPGTRKGPSTPNHTPCHYMLSIPTPTPVRTLSGGGAVPRQFWSGSTPGTHKSPSTPNHAPCHYTLSIPAPTPLRPSPGGGAVPRHVVARGGRVERGGPCGCQASRYRSMVALLSLLLALFLTFFGAHKRMQKVRKQRVPVGFLAVFKATLRGHLAYTYLLCRHLTRYYTLLLLAVSLLIPPLLLLTCLLCGIVIVVDYRRLKPDMSLGGYALCALLDDCAYEVGVIWGCVKQRTWKPLLPIIKVL
jgi:mycofactocin system glycosyltransferase